ncbi:Uncharacterized protein dnm_081110 [Desulfonema magnum]|uniref:Uncharacterized protein n=1 Tax=Desulfonema magnum TaxID=45655 RepID=A0A975GSL5_9BACT|nr:Uncharacterized protein dnm_081110 [Desulfonema magnum]
MYKKLLIRYLFSDKNPGVSKYIFTVKNVRRSHAQISNHFFGCVPPFTHFPRCGLPQPQAAYETSADPETRMNAFAFQG